ncbi:MAG: hypothetical protein KC931_26290 [Candidatus Omnitrophica bacterium]|nr:hypothetical protein [Candidatus Omnitrophota bacterium]
MAAGDFYFAINATFRFIHDRHGEEALIAYWRKMGKEYYRPLIDQFRQGGLEAVETYWRGFFDSEPGGEVEVSRTAHGVELAVLDCPAIRWLRTHNREIMPLFCDHCLHVSGALAEESGLTFSLEGGGGSCHQTFALREEERS